MMATKEECSRQLVKIADNNVELQYYLFGSNNNKVILSEHTESFGSKQLLNIEFMQQVQTAMDSANNTIIEL